MLPSPVELKQPPFYHEMILVEGGTFMMGSDFNDYTGDMKPIHKVGLFDYYLAKYPVTQAFWKAVMGKNPSYFVGDNHPVEQVSWLDVQVFINKLNQLTGESYRLPTEAEWEYAARGGIKSQGVSYAGSSEIDEVAWYMSNSGNKTKPVGLKLPNELGIYDMSGNVWEWCWDWYAEYPGGDRFYPEGPEKGEDRVQRGGSWGNHPTNCHVTCRDCWLPGNKNGTLGFRLATQSLLKP